MEKPNYCPIRAQRVEERNQAYPGLTIRPEMQAANESESLCIGEPRCAGPSRTARGLFRLTCGNPEAAIAPEPTNDPNSTNETN